MTDFCSIKITDVIPQRPPFLFVDRLVDCTLDSARTEFRVPEDCTLLENGELGVSGVLENMAQSCAALTGYVCKYILHLPVKIGYIGSVRDFTLSRRPRAGELLVTNVSKKEEIFGIMLSEVTVSCGSEILAGATIKTALSEEEAAL